MAEEDIEEPIEEHGGSLTNNEQEELFRFSKDEEDEGDTEKGGG